MLAQRKGAPVESAAAKPRGSVAAKARPASGSRKMSFKDRHALESLPGQMAALQAKMEKLNAELSDPGLYTKNPVRFNLATKALTEAQDKLAAAEAQWLELEMMREEMEG